MKKNGKAVITSFTHARTQNVDVCLSTSGVVFIISVKCTAEFMELKSLLRSSAALRTVGVPSIPNLLYQCTRNVHTESFPCLRQILREVPSFWYCVVQ